MDDYRWEEMGQRMRDLRIVRGLSQQALADAAGITQAGLHRIECGQTNPQIDSLQRIAAALSTSVRQLVTGAPTAKTMPWIHRIARVLQSGDDVAISTLENAVRSAEALLVRGGRTLRIADDPIEFRRLTGYMHPAEFAKTATGKAARQATQLRAGQPRKAAKKGSQAFVAGRGHTHA